MNLPKGWKGVCLGDVLSRIDYGSASKSESSGSFPVLRMGNLKDGKIDWNDLVYSSSKGEYKKYALNYGDILFNRTNSRDLVGKTSIYRGECPAIFAGYLIRLRTQNFCDPFFLNAFMNSASFADFCRIARTDAIGQSNINAQSLQRCELMLPPLPEQKAIADLLSTWDAAIEKTEQLIAAKEKQFQWLLDELITKPSRNGKWKNVKFGDLYNKEIVIEKGRPLTREEIGNSGTIPVVAGGQTYSCYNNSATHSVETITVSSSGAYAGFVWYHSYPIWASDCSVITSKTINMNFLYHTLKSKQLAIYALQTGGAQPHIYSKDLANIAVAIPRRKDQNQIASILDSTNKEIDVMKNIADKYKTQKRGLMQRLLNGQWRVKPEIIKNYGDSAL
jgi:type I restriction enzyme S subunit